MGNVGKVRYWTIQERKGVGENERGRVQEEDKEGIGQTARLEKPKEGCRKTGRGRVLQITAVTGQALWP